MDRQSWLLDRAGKFTSSRIYDIIPLKDKFEDCSKTAQTYIFDKAAELNVGIQDKPPVIAMQWGNDNEPLAFEGIKKRFPSAEYLGGENPEFYPIDDNSGGSPDGISLHENIVFEIKCPYNPAVHMKYYFYVKDGESLKKIEPKYYYQIQMNILAFAKQKKVKPEDCIGIFVSFDPRAFTEKGRYHQAIIKYDPKEGELIMKTISKATEFLNTIIKQVL